MFPPLDILLDYWIELVSFGLLYVMFTFPTKIFYSGVPGLATECHYGVWCRVLVLYFLQSTSAFSFYIEVVLILSIKLQQQNNANIHYIPHDHSLLVLILLRFVVSSDMGILIWSYFLIFVHHQLRLRTIYDLNPRYQISNWRTRSALLWR